MKSKVFPQALKVIRLKEEIDGCMSIYFLKPHDFRFVPGDCFNLFFKEKDFNEGRIFSFSSSPTEELLQVTFRKGISKYKKRLEKVVSGDTLYFSNFGTQYEFDLSRPLIFFAGGVGITIFRSIIKLVIDKGLMPSFTLFYSNRSEDFLFQKELNEWARQLNMPIHYISTMRQGRLTGENVVNLIPTISNVKYAHYIVGPPMMVDATNEMLLSLNVDSANIYTDSFDGYFEES